jgi:hypothetical protein
VATQRKPTSKAIEQDLKADTRLYFQLSLAEALHCTLFELKNRVSEEEMILWQVFYKIKKDRQEAELEKAKQNAKRR